MYTVNSFIFISNTSEYSFAVILHFLKLKLNDIFLFFISVFFLCEKVSEQTFIQIQNKREIHSQKKGSTV